MISASSTTGVSTSVSRPAERVGWPLLVSVLVLAAVNFLWQLGSSSLFEDEVLSWHPAVLSLHGLYENIKAGELAPPGYYFLLHEWIGQVHSQREWVMRLPSVLAGVALVAAVYWLATLVADRGTALLAAFGAALSPMVLGFAQEARAYIFAVLLVTVGVAALLEARRRSGGWPRMLWLIAAAAASVGAFWMHYTADLVLAPALIWFVWRPGASTRGRIVLPAVCAVADLVLAPLLVHQLGRGNQAGIAASATLTFDHAAAVIAAPFSGRVISVSAWVLIGALVVLVTLAISALRVRSPRFRLLGEIVLPAAVIPIVALFAITIFSSSPVLLARYASVAAPFLLILIAFAILHESRLVGVPVAIAALIAGIGETAHTHSDSGAYPNTRAAIANIAAKGHPGDFILAGGYPALPGALDYYLGRDELGLPVIYPNRTSTLLPALVHGHHRMWLLSSAQNLPAHAIAHTLGSLGYRASELDHYPGSPPLGLVLAVPR
ncbi:MAG: glycosyltransferase family 39 protein [Solirubrobacteraceae bacterium]